MVGALYFVWYLGPPVCDFIIVFVFSHFLIPSGALAVQCFVVVGGLVLLGIGGCILVFVLCFLNWSCGLGHSLLSYVLMLI